MTEDHPDHPETARWRERSRRATAAEVGRAVRAASPGPDELALLLSPAASSLLEPMAQRAAALTRSRFGRTMALYVPLYLSDYCTGGCAYCGFASDRRHPRRRLEPDALRRELAALKRHGFEEVLLLTGERTPEAGYDYVRACVAMAAEQFHQVTVETFPMTTEEYRGLAAAGCTGVTLYQETYDPATYRAMHRWGPKREYAARRAAPARVLEAGIRLAGLGVLLGLADPVADALCLYFHARELMRTFWRGGVTLSFPRLCAESGGFIPPRPVSEAYLAQLIFAFRICLPDVHLVLSTRERPAFRDGMAGVGISKMSVASRTTVGGYETAAAGGPGQFAVNDARSVGDFSAMLRAKRLEPVFKNWDAAYR